MKVFSTLTYLFIAVFLFSGCSNGADPEAEITIVDIKDRPIPGAIVELFSRPTNLISEDIKITNEDGKTFHKFVFEGTLDVAAHINTFQNYHNLSGVGEITLTRDEICKITITLTEPVVGEE
ncbi:MAG: hypothetical protein U9R19_18395 [Bacteroidota bacterium]|nr:hypothetical protein [Bacteroidota bacterium]